MPSSTMSTHRHWTIRVNPRTTDDGAAWRAIIEVWRPDTTPSDTGGILVDFFGTAPDEPEIVNAALAVARRYIDLRAQK